MNRSIFSWRLSSTKEDLGKIDGCYDRAAMIAAHGNAKKYIEKIKGLSLDSVLLISIDYDANDGNPPFYDRIRN